MQDSLLLLLVYVVGVVTAALQVPESMVTAPGEPGGLVITTFNTAGLSDTWNETRSAWYKKLFQSGDITVLQELRGDPGMIRSRLSPALPSNHTLLISQAMGRTEYYKERYGLLLNTSSVSVGDQGVLRRVNRSVNRPPQRVRIRAENISFTTYNIHTDPETASEEIGRISSALREDDDALLIGDFNADCSYGDGEDVHDAFTVLVSDDADTTVGPSNCAYDRVAANTGVARLHRTTTVGSAPEWISDHRPVQTTYEVAS